MWIRFEQIYTLYIQNFVLPSVYRVPFGVHTAETYTAETIHTACKE